MPRLQKITWWAVKDINMKRHIALAETWKIRVKRHLMSLWICLLVSISLNRGGNSSCKKFCLHLWCVRKTLWCSVRVCSAINWMNRLGRADISLNGWGWIVWANATPIGIGVYKPLNSRATDVPVFLNFGRCHGTKIWDFVNLLPLCGFLRGWRGKKFYLWQKYRLLKRFVTRFFQGWQVRRVDCFKLLFWKKHVRVLLGNRIILCRLGNKDPWSLADQLAKIGFQRDSMPQNSMLCLLCVISIVYSRCYTCF